MWISSDQCKRLLASLLQQHPIANELRGSKFRYAPLAHAEEFPRTTDAQIFLCNLESIGGPHQGLQPLLRCRRGEGRIGPHTSTLFRDQQTIRGLCPTTYAASQLMQLRQAEPIGVLNEHDR